MSELPCPLCGFVNCACKEQLRKADKYDDGKLPMHLLPRQAQKMVLEVLRYGANKYNAHNWRKGLEYTRLLNAAERHLIQLQEGRDIDIESGLHHAAHAICSLMFLLEMPKEWDDRYGKTNS